MGDIVLKSRPVIYSNGTKVPNWRYCFGFFGGGLQQTFTQVYVGDQKKWIWPDCSFGCSVCGACMGCLRKMISAEGICLEPDDFFCVMSRRGTHEVRSDFDFDAYEICNREAGQ